MADTDNRHSRTTEPHGEKRRLDEGSRIELDPSMGRIQRYQPSSFSISKILFYRERFIFIGNKILFLYTLCKKKIFQPFWTTLFGTLENRIVDSRLQSAKFSIFKYWEIIFKIFYFSKLRSYFPICDSVYQCFYIDTFRCSIVLSFSPVTWQFSVFCSCVKMVKDEEKKIDVEEWNEVRICVVEFWTVLESLKPLLVNFITREMIWTFVFLSASWTIRKRASILFSSTCSELWIRVIETAISFL